MRTVIRGVGASRAVLAGAMLLVVFGAARVDAQPVPGFGQKVPYVLILLDTSGSMEYTEAENVLPVCTSVYDPSKTYVKSRWAVALEVFTGTFENYWCTYDWRISPTTREDFAYPVPHVAVQTFGAVSQIPNGFLDVNAQYANFGFLAFDSNYSMDMGSAGGYSYGDAKLNADGVSINLGARSAYANDAGVGSYTKGGLVEVARKDLPGVLEEKNREIQDVMLGTVPFGGSPVSPLLSDTRYYMNHDPRMLPYVDKVHEDGDPFYDCRTRNVILFTDGRPTMGEGDGGYGLSADEAAALYSTHPLGVKTYVVGYSLDDEDVRNALDAIAKAGDPGNEDAAAYEAKNQAQLVLKLSEILGDITAGVRSRTVPVYTNATRSVDAQYQFNTAYGGVSFNSLDQQGYLEQQIYSCDAECKTNGDGAQICDTFSISDALDEATLAPKTYAIVGDSVTPFAKTNNDITPDLLGISKKGLDNAADGFDTLLSLQPAYIPPENPKQALGTVLLRSDSAADRAQLRDELIDFVLGDAGSRREGKRLGAIRHGTPAVQHALRGQSSIIPSFRFYQEQIKDRPTVLYVPTHTGQLTAFRVDRGPDVQSDEYGKALWSFIPNALLPRLKDNGAQLHYLMDLAPVVRDILMSASQLATEPEDEAASWRSVLVQGYRDGGRGYFALDVTDPEKPSLMWEVSSAGRCEKSKGCDPSEATAPKNDFCYLGYSYSRPVVGSVYLEGYGGVSQQDRAVAVFGGGKLAETSDAVDPNPCGGHTGFKQADIGHGLYVVDLETGAIVREFRASNSSDPGMTSSDRARMIYDVVGSPACHSNTNGAVMTRCFVGDAGGQLWRVDLSSSNPAEWKMSFFHDAYESLGVAQGSPDRGPIEEPPTLAMQRSTGLVTVIYATTNIDFTESMDARHAVYSLSEEVTFDETGGEATSITAHENWKLVFDADSGPLRKRTMVVGTPIVFDEVTYFTTFRFDPEAGCGVKDDDAARLWGVHYFRTDPEETLGEGTPLPALDQDGDPLTTPNDVVATVALGKIIPYGVQLIQRPSCFGDVPVDYAASSGYVDQSAGMNAGGLGKGDMEIVVQYEGELQGASPVGPKAASGKVAAVQTLTRSVRPARTTVQAVSWGLVYD